jgi:glycosyltransferase involved in cell wall biosynthesis
MELISVIMPSYNAAHFIREAIESILEQDDADFELIVVDDCSTDNTALISFEYAQRDSRVSVLRTPTNMGISGALNVGLAAARGALIARMDADDISLPLRLSRQRSYLHDHPTIGLCGMSIEIIDADSRTLRRPRTAVGADLIESLTAWCSPLAHPTWMFRREVFNSIGGYRDVAPAEDYDFLLRVLEAGWGLANIPELGLRYRVSASSTASRRALTQRKAFNYVRRVHRNNEVLTRESFIESTTSSPLMTWMHQLSERMLASAVAWHSKFKPLALIPLAAALLISPFQAQFVFRAIVVKWLISRKFSRD